MPIGSSAVNVVMQHAQNFRAIPPVAGRDGRMLRAGVLYRSGDLSELTPRCVEQLQSLGIRSIVDLRSESERRQSPYRWLAQIDSNAWLEPSEDATASIGELARHALSTEHDVAAAMSDLYRDLPFSHAASFSTLFRRIVEGRLPILFGCFAGKDRTGVAAALLLWSIGADAAAIETDYLRSNDAIDSLRRLSERKFDWVVTSAKTELPLRAEPLFLRAAMSEVSVRCGGIDRYVHDVLGITPAERRAAEDNLLSNP